MRAFCPTLPPAKRPTASDLPSLPDGQVFLVDDDGDYLIDDDGDYLTTAE